MAGSSARCASSCPAVRTRSRHGSGRDAAGQWGTRLRARRHAARPPQGDGAHPGAPGDQHRGGRRRGRHRRRTEGGQVCVQVFFYRTGRNYGNRAYYPAHAKDAASGEMLAAFLGPVLRRAGARPDWCCWPSRCRSRRCWPRRWRCGPAARSSCWCRSAAGGASWSRTRSPMPARRWPAGWPTRPARRRCSSSWPNGSTCPTRRGGSRSTTTATSRAAMRSAPSSSPGPKGSTSAATAPSTSRAPTWRRATTTP